MKNLTRRTRLAVVPAVFAALALSACQDEAPSAAPPTPASPTAGATQDGGDAPATEDGGDAPAATQSQAAPTEEPSQAPETSDSGGDDSGSSASGGCENTSSFAFNKGSAEAKPQDEVQTATYKSSGGQAKISFGKPKMDTSGGDSYFPGDGKQTVIYPVTIEMTGGSYFIATRLAFGLVDGQDKSCKSDVLNAVIPESDEVPVESMKPGDKLSKKLAFAVPAGADLKDYSLLFASDYSSGSAELAWKGK